MKPENKRCGNGKCLEYQPDIINPLSHCARYSDVRACAKYRHYKNKQRRHALREIQLGKRLP